VQRIVPQPCLRPVQLRRWPVASVLRVARGQAPRHPGRSLDHLPGLNDTAAQTRPDYCRDGRVLTAGRPEMHVMGIERAAALPSLL
jgi:hypothetical protein